MARPSVKAKRTEEILQAYEHCIALYGVEGATLQKIAEVAGIARPLLRHHVGNSDDLLNMALKRFIERSDAMTKAAFKAGLIIETSGAEDQVVKVFCPLTISDENLTRGMDILEKAVQSVCLGEDSLPNETDYFDHVQVDDDVKWAS